jgi:hypothetical protein
MMEVVPCPEKPLLERADTGAMRALIEQGCPLPFQPALSHSGPMTCYHIKSEEKSKVPFPNMVYML